MKRYTVTLVLLVLLLACPAAAQPDTLIQPDDLMYLGAFLPPQDAPDGFGWSYSGQALAYYPDGDPTGPDDGFPGSLFGVGHNWNQYISEMSIPVPVISKNPDDLNIATTLQPFSDVRAGMFDFGEMDIPQVGLAYLPAQGDQTTGKLYFSWSPWLPEEDYRPSFGWAELDLSAPQSAGMWTVGNYRRYETAKYLFPIDPAWADAHVGGRRLATGRFREGGQLGAGPTIFAIAPWQQGNPPPPDTALESVLLLQYHPYDDPSGRRMDNYADSDQWMGGAWLTVGERSAVVFVGSKGLGNTWYGFANGVVYAPPYPETPPWPYDGRGFWSDDFEAQILFYDPADLAAVARGEIEPWQPQPYAALSIDQHLFDTDDEPIVKVERIGGVTFDAANGLLYIIEPIAIEDTYDIIHVFKVG